MEISTFVIDITIKCKKLLEIYCRIKIKHYLCITKVSQSNTKDMKTLNQLIQFCEKNNIKYEIKKQYLDNYTWLDDEERHEFGTYFGMCNIAGRKGLSEWQWTWFHSYDKMGELTDDSMFWFDERYSMVNGKSYKGWRESARASEIIEKGLTA